MSDNNNQIQNFSNNNFSNNNRNNNNPIFLRQGIREIQLNINPEIFQTSILNSINQFINNNQNNKKNNKKIIQV